MERANLLAIPKKKTTDEIILLEKERIIGRLAEFVGRASVRMIENMEGAIAGQHPEQAPAIIDAAKTPQRDETPPPDAFLKQMNDARASMTSLLHDVDYRLKTLLDAIDRQNGTGDRVGASQLNLASHILDGYTLTNNSPTAGKIAWASCFIVYKGTTHTITDGNTDKKYVWWLLASPTIFTTGDTKPTLGADDILVFYNNGGVGIPVMDKLQHGASLVDSSINSTELANSAVTADKLAALAVTAGKIATGGVSAASQFAAGVVDATAIGSGAVIAAKIGAGQVAETKLNLATHLLY